VGETASQMGTSLLTLQDVAPLKIRGRHRKFVLAPPVKPSLKLSLTLSKPLIKFVGTRALKEPIVVRLEVAADSCECRTACEWIGAWRCSQMAPLP